LRQVDGDLIQLHTAIQETIDVDGAGLDGAPVDTTDRFIDQATIPFLRPDRPVTQPGISAELVSAIEKTLTVARARTSPRAELVKQVLGALETIATDATGQFASSVIAAREIYGTRPTDDGGIMPLYDALDLARIITASSVHQISVSDTVRAGVLHA